VHAENGATGLALARHLQPDLVLLDMQLPDIDGHEVLRQLRAEAATAGLRVVALSANAMAEDIERTRRGGADDYWTKPIDSARFLAEVKPLLAATDRS
jgi:CheY-like chemotaxis protein